MKALAPSIAPSIAPSPARALLATLAASLLTACGQELVCPSDQVACAGHCAATAVDPQNCGACGNPCATGETCRAGTCTDCASVCGAGRCVEGTCLADLYVACFASDEVRGVMADLQPAGPPFRSDNGPVSLASSGGAVWVSHSLAPTLLGLRPDRAAPLRITLGGSDIEVVRPFGALLAASDSGSGTLVVVDPVRAAAVDEVDLAASPGDYPNPLAPAFAGTTAYVPLYGSAAVPSFAEAQAVAVADLSGSGTCAAPPCGSVVKRIALGDPLTSTCVAGTCDPPGFPFPSRAVAVEAPPGRFRVFVTLANLKLGAFGYYTDPAGHGRLAVVDAGAGDALSAVDLGPDCLNPGGIAALGTTVWVACGGTGKLVPVDASPETPLVGTAVALPAFFVPGNLAFCSGQGFVTDQYSGNIDRFDPAGLAPVATTEVCPVDPVAGWAWAADVACGP
jgi:hypothetical protein